MIGVYLVTWLLTEILTNNAAVALMFPIAVSAAQQLELNLLPFIMMLMIAGSASFATPIGYQTNLMVYGPGGYRFTDYARTASRCCIPADPPNSVPSIARVAVRIYVMLRWRRGHCGVRLGR